METSYFNKLRKEMGDLYAYYQLALSYNNGLNGFTKNPEKAKMYCRKIDTEFRDNFSELSDTYDFEYTYGILSKIIALKLSLGDSKNVISMYDVLIKYDSSYKTLIEYSNFCMDMHMSSEKQEYSRTALDLLLSIFDRSDILDFNIDYLTKIKNIIKYDIRYTGNFQYVEICLNKLDNCIKKYRKKILNFEKSVKTLKEKFFDDHSGKIKEYENIINDQKNKIKELEITANDNLENGIIIDNLKNKMKELELIVNNNLEHEHMLNGIIENIKKTSSEEITNLKKNHEINAELFNNFWEDIGQELLRLSKIEKDYLSLFNEMENLKKNNEKNSELFNNFWCDNGKELIRLSKIEDDNKKLNDDIDSLYCDLGVLKNDNFEFKKMLNDAENDKFELIRMIENKNEIIKKLKEDNDILDKWTGHLLDTIKDNSIDYEESIVLRNLLEDKISLYEKEKKSMIESSELKNEAMQRYEFKNQELQIQINKKDEVIDFLRKDIDKTVDLIENYKKDDRLTKKYIETMNINTNKLIISNNYLLCLHELLNKNLDSVRQTNDLNIEKNKMLVDELIKLKYDNTILFKNSLEQNKNMSDIELNNINITKELEQSNEKNLKLKICLELKDKEINKINRTLMAKKDDYNIIIDNYKTKLDHIEKDNKNLKINSDKVLNEKLDLDSKYQELLEQYNALKTKTDSLMNNNIDLINSNCTLMEKCNITKEDSLLHIEENVNLKSMITSKDNDIKVLSDDLIDQKRINSKLNDIIESNKIKISELDNEVSDIKFKNLQLNEDNIKLKESYSNLEDLYKDTLVDIENQKNNHSEIMSELKKNDYLEIISELKKIIEEKNKKIINNDNIIGDYF